MRENENKPYSVGTILYEDTRKKERITRDLEAYARLLNSLAEELTANGYETDFDNVGEVFYLQILNPSVLIEHTKLRYEAEAQNIKFAPIKERFLNGFSAVEADITGIFNRYKDELSKPFSDFVTEAGAERLELQEGWRNEFVGYNTDNGYFLVYYDKIDKYCRSTITTEYQAEIMNEARELFDRLKALEARVLVDSCGALHLYNRVENNVNSLIEIDTDNGLFFNPEKGGLLLDEDSEMANTVASAINDEVFNAK